MDLEIAAQARSATGKRNRQLRRTGQLPGVVYGKDTDSLAIPVDVTPLVDLESSLHVRDLVIPENVHVQTDGDELIARVLPPRIEEEPEVEEEAVEGEGVEGEEGAAAAEGEAQPTEGEAGGSEDEGR